jgi:hypothetical protein
MNELHCQVSNRSRSLGSGRTRVDSPAMAAPVAKPTHLRFAITATYADVWPLSPEEAWSTG